LAHPPGKPDFHHSDCFALELPAAYTKGRELPAAYTKGR
jgi:hypothetical protein